MFGPFLQFDVGFFICKGGLGCMGSLATFAAAACSEDVERKRYRQQQLGQRSIKFAKPHTVCQLLHVTTWFRILFKIRCITCLCSILHTYANRLIFELELPRHHAPTQRIKCRHELGHNNFLRRLPYNAGTRAFIVCWMNFRKISN